MRLAVSRAIAVETTRGWRISKTTAAHKIDVVVALAMACHAAVKGQAEPAPFNTNYAEWAGGGEDDIEAWRRLRTWAYVSSGGAVQLW